MGDPLYTPNPLRPYYIPPSIGTETQAIPNSTAATTPKTSSASVFSFSDLDYSEYIPDASPSVTGTIRSALDKAVWRYSSVLMAQPFENAKIILQTRVAQDYDGEANLPQIPNAEDGDAYEEPDSEDEEPNYFTSTAPFTKSSPAGTPRHRSSRSRRVNPPEKKVSQSRTSLEELQLKDPRSLLEALSSLSSNEGTFAIWKATNSTFIYNLLFSGLETFSRSFLAAVFGIADSDLILSTSSFLPDATTLITASPSTTVLIVTAASAFSALVLAPLDTARTRLILTPLSRQPRSLLGALRSLRTSWLIPTHLVPITFLTSTIPTLIATSTPLFLKTYAGLDPIMNPTSWSICTFLGSALDISIKFPLQTVLRRAQVATWTSSSLSSTYIKKSQKSITTIVPVPTTYKGVLPTIWGIMREEGFSESQKDKTAALMGKAPRRRRRGQGVEGLYRGWRVGLWGLVGIWSTGFVGGLQSASEDTTPGLHGGKF